MRAIAVALLQLILSFTVVALSLPALLFRLPALRTRAVGPAVGLGLMALVFLLLRLIWRRAKRAES